MASLFTKILNGEINGTIVHQDEHCFAIKDIQPQAPIHLLVIPKKEIRSVADASAEDKLVLGHLLFVAAEIARAQGFAEDGFRIAINTNGHGGQTVPHLHVHVLGGRQLSWPPG